MPDRSNLIPDACETPKRAGFRTAGADLVEIEQIAARHPAVQECAVIMVEDCFGSWEPKVFIKAATRALAPADVIAWCALRLPACRVPRFAALVGGFDRSSGHEVSKESLPWSSSDCLDLGRERRWRSLLSGLPLF